MRAAPRSLRGTERGAQLARVAIDAAERSRTLQRRFLTELLDLDDVRVDAAVELGMMARAYERLTDHAVEIARRVVFAATGAPPDAITLPGGDDWAGG